VAVAPQNHLGEVASTWLICRGMSVLGNPSVRYLVVAPKMEMVTDDAALSAGEDEAWRR
jgi:hypothetical protein